jgi:hypothetical protein
MRTYRYPDDEAGGGGGASDQEAGGAGQSSPQAGTPPALDLTTKVKLEDGTEVSVGDLMKSHTEVADVTRQRDEYQSKMNNVMSLFKEDTPMEQRQQATRAILADAGYGAEEIDAYMDVVGLNPNEMGGGDDAAGAGGDEGSGGDDQRTQQLEAQLSMLQRQQHQQRVRQLETTLNHELDKTVDSNKDLKVLFDKTLRLQSSDASDEDRAKAVANAKDAVKRQLKREALEQLNIRRSRAGMFEDAWMAEEVDKAVKPVLDLYQSVIGDINQLGRTPETVAGGATGRGVLDQKPLPRPEFKAGEDNRSKLTAWATDQLTRLAHSPREGESVV